MPVPVKATTLDWPKSLHVSDRTITGGDLVVAVSSFDNTYATETPFNALTPSAHDERVSPMYVGGLYYRGIHVNFWNPQLKTTLLGAKRAFSNYDTFYGRIHLDPIELALGNLTGVTTRLVRLWSAFFEQNTLLSVPATGDTGIEIDYGDMETPPIVFDALEERVLTVVVSTDGPAVIDAAFPFIFAQGNLTTLLVTGNRVIVFSYPHNWAQEINESFEWRTDVITSVNGTEQRRAMRQLPKYFVATDHIIQGEEAPIYKNMVYGWQGRDFALPMWQYTQDTSVNLSAGDTIVAMETAGIPLKAGGFVIFWTDTFVYETAEILSVSVGFITLRRPLVSDWAAGTRLMPIITGKMSRDTVSKQPISTAIEPSIVWELDHASTIATVSAPEEPAMYDGIGIQLLPPNRGVDVGSISTREGRNILDYGAGIRLVDDLWARGGNKFSVEWWLTDRLAIEKFKKFMSERKGKARRFFMPTWNRDFEQVIPINAPDAFLTVTNTRYSEFQMGNTDFSHVIIMMKNGTNYTRRIVGAVDNLDGTETITLDSSFGVAFQPSAIKMISLLPAVRFTSDVIELRWVTSSFAKVNAQVKVVKWI